MNYEVSNAVLDAVVVAIADGAARLIDIAADCGLRLPVVWLAVRHLEATGLIINDPFHAGVAFPTSRAVAAAKRIEAATATRKKPAAESLDSSKPGQRSRHSSRANNAPVPA